MSSTLIWLLLILIVIIFLIWLCRCRSCGSTTTPEVLKPLKGRDDAKPVTLEKPEGEPDDLKKISGIGPKLEQTLNELGIFHFHQIADFTDENIAWIDENLKFKGRIKRDNWVAKARELAKGG